MEVLTMSNLADTCILSSNLADTWDAHAVEELRHLQKSQFYLWRIILYCFTCMKNAII